MMLSGQYHSLIFLFSVAFAATNTSVQSTCGFLIAYNQYSDLLETAPQCFRNGCGRSSLSSLSTGCDSNAPCYSLWSILNKEHQAENNWCDKCRHDRACRIPGWPVLNATSACNRSPGAWIFGPNGSCCGEDTGPIDLSSWITKICNGTYRDQFASYDGMAKIDWEDYIAPYNYSVRPVNSTQLTLPTPKCPSTPRYFGLFVAENLVLLLLVVSLTASSLNWIRLRENNVPWTTKVSDKWKPIKNKIKNIIPSSGSGKGELILAIVIAVFMAGFQLAGNFIVATIIKKDPGYQETPIPRLALLFCARPRLGWTACLVWLISDNKLKAFLNGEKYLRQARLVLARAAMSSAISEIIMQLLGAYSMGKATDIGVKRNFYLVNHLWPFWRGKDARILYLGSLWWLIAAAAIILTWALVLWFAAAVFLFWNITKNAAKNAANNQFEKLPDRVKRKFARTNPASPAHSINRSNTGLTSDRDGIMVPIREDDQIQHANPIHSGHTSSSPDSESQVQKPVAEKVITRDSQIMRPTHTIVPPESLVDSGTTDLESQPMRPTSRTGAQTEIGSPFTMISTDADSTHSYHDQPMHPGAGNGGHEGRRDAHGSGPLSTFESSTLGGTATAFNHAPKMSERVTPAHIDSHPTNNPTVAVHATAPSTRRQVPPRLANLHADTIKEKPTYDPATHRPETYEAWKPWVLSFAVALGFVSYICQWLFWAGLVKTWGSRWAIFRASSVRLIGL
jgi:hypothetical protein